MVHRADVSSSVMQDKVRALFAWAPVPSNQLACQLSACDQPPISPCGVNAWRRSFCAQSQLSGQISNQPTVSNHPHPCR